jgi:hypothetical protein
MEEERGLTGEPRRSPCKMIMIKLSYSLIAAILGAVCIGLWVLLAAIEKAFIQIFPADWGFHAWVQFCLKVRPVLLIIPILGILYSTWRCFRKNTSLESVVAYLVLVLLVCVILIFIVAISISVQWLTGAPFGYQFE